MSSSLRIATSGLVSQQRNLDAIANNIANQQTVGFKRTRVEFQDLAYNVAPQVEMSGDGASLVAGPEGAGVRVSATQVLYAQGALQDTGNPLDLAVEGEGFFQVQLADGTVTYTRDGAFHLDAQRRIVNQDGLILSPGITLPSGAELTSIDPEGNVWAQVPGSEPTRVGQILVARFPNAEGLAPIGRNLFAPTEASGKPTTAQPDSAGNGAIRPGMLEQANVNLADEISRMIQAQRAYQLGLQAVRIWDNLAAQANNLRR